MDSLVNNIWKRFSGKQLDGSLLQNVEQTLQIEQALGHKLKVCVGTDSQKIREKIEFATAVVFVREKKGGFMFTTKFRMHKVMSVKERMIQEVAKSVEVAYALCDLLDRYHVDLEVHADINTDPMFKSNKALKEAMGYILGMGFVFKAKPNAFASTSCADKLVN